MKSIGTGAKIVYLDEIDKAIDATEKTLVMLKKIKCAGKAHSDVRRLGKAEVAGSIPVASSKKSKALTCPNCKHLQALHNYKGCFEKVCDAAGDMDWCPCERSDF